MGMQVAGPLGTPVVAVDMVVVVDTAVAVDIVAEVEQPGGYMGIFPLYVLVKVPVQVLYRNYWAQGKF